MSCRSRFRELRQKDALERQKARDTRTPQQQLERLDSLLGEGQGAVKERARLTAQIQKEEEEKKFRERIEQLRKEKTTRKKGK
jgi:hypothetical protein